MEDLARVLRSSQVFVLPSFFEGLPRVVLEALACGCRIVVTDLPGIDSWLSPELEENGFVERVKLPRLVRVDEACSLNPGDRRDNHAIMNTKRNYTIADALAIFSTITLVIM